MGNEACGRVCVRIDGDSCNAVGKPCNVAGVATGPITANFALCPTPKGVHAVSVRLLGDNGSPILNAAGNAPIESTIAVTAN